MRRFGIPCLVLALVLVLSGTVLAQRRLVLDDFEDPWLNFHSYHDDDGSSLVMDKAKGNKGEGLQFTFEIVEDGWAGAWYSLSGRDLSAYTGGTLSFWLHGDGSGSSFWMTMADAELDVFVFETKVDWVGWEHVVIPLTDFKFLRTRGENTDGILTLKNMDSLAIDILPLAKGTLIFDDLTLTAAQ